MYLVSIQSPKTPQPKMYYAENSLIVSGFVDIMPSDTVVHISEIKNLSDLTCSYYEELGESSERD